MEFAERCVAWLRSRTEEHCPWEDSRKISYECINHLARMAGVDLERITRETSPQSESCKHFFETNPGTAGTHVDQAVKT